MRSSRMENLCVYYPFWYLTMYPGVRFPMEPSLMGAEDSERASESVSEVGSSEGFSLGGPGSGVVSVKGGLLRDSRGSSSSLSESSG